MSISGIKDFIYKNEYLTQNSINIIITYPTYFVIEENRHNLVYEIIATPKFQK